MKPLFVIFCILLSSVAFAADNVGLMHAPIDSHNQASLQRGAKYYMNYCSGCHSLKYMRYDVLAKGIGITDSEGKVLTDLLKDNLMFATKKVSEPIVVAMQPQDSVKWFGVAPPDLSLETRARGVDWVYSFLHNFYEDKTRPWGVNNLTYKGVGMPHVLAPLQGEQVPVYETPNHSPTMPHLVGLRLEKKGRLTPKEYDQMVSDIVNFLAYVADPIKNYREHIGKFVLLFLLILSVFAYLLKREYWKDIH